MAPRVLVLNAGSSTLKASIVEAHAPGPRYDEAPALPPIASVSIELGDDASRGADVAGAFDAVMAELGRAGGLPEEVEAVAHRVVHGGSTYTGPTVIDDRVLAGIDALTPLAPLHQPVAVATIRAAMDRLTEPPHVAVFDTAFHATIAESAWRYPVPRAWDEWGIRRYGFHGLSVAWSVERASALFGRPVGELGLVVAHLGNGCSVTAVAGGRSVATSMGLTPLEGLMMGTRSGSIDPGIIVGLVRDGRLDLDEMADALDHRSGLLGISGSSGDMRSLEAAADGGDTAASLAIAMFVERAAAAIAAASTSLERLHAVVFTGGIGSGSGRVRSAIVARLAVLGIAPLDGGDDRAERDGIVAASDGSSPAVLRIEAREDVVAARAAVDAIPAR